MSDEKHLSPEKIAQLREHYELVTAQAELAQRKPKRAPWQLALVISLGLVAIIGMAVFIRENFSVEQVSTGSNIGERVLFNLSDLENKPVGTLTLANTDDEITITAAATIADGTYTLWARMSGRSEPLYLETISFSANAARKAFPRGVSLARIESITIAESGDSRTIGAVILTGERTK